MSLDRFAVKLTDSAALGGAVEREWRRFTPRQRLMRFAVYLLIVAAVIVSLRTIDIIPEFLADAPAQMADMLRRMWPIDYAELHREAAQGMIETINIASLGTLITLVMALPVGVMASRNITRSAILNWVARFILVTSRSVNSLVWALLFVAVFGPGALAGTFAIAFRSIGFVGKLFAESLEECQRGPIEALQAAGAPATSLGATVRAVCFDAADGYVDTPVLWRPDLAPGTVLAGPAIIEEFGSTVPVHPGFDVRVDEFLNLIVTRSQA